MYISSTISYLVRIVIFVCVIHWSSSDANQQNLRDKNESYKLFTHYRKDVSSSKNESQPILEKRQHAKSEISRTRFSEAGTSAITRNDSDTTVRPKREKRCLLTVAALGGAASAASWFMPVQPKPKLKWRSAFENRPLPRTIPKDRVVITETSTNVNILINYNKAMTTLKDKNLGRLVINGLPKYNIVKAVYVMEVTRVIMHGIWGIEFVHPPTGKRIQVPADVGDDYVVTRQVFKIFVDNNETTYMIFKGLDRGEVMISFGGSPDVALCPSIGGVPKYDISKAFIIDNTVQQVVQGILVLEFVHPVTRKLTRVPFQVGDVHVNHVTKKVYLIYVDKSGKTYLILKGVMMQDLGPSVGNIVVNGQPKFDLSRATIVMNTHQKMNLYGCITLEFVHPFTKDIIQIPVNGGQTYYDKKNRNWYIIFVDALGRTLLAFTRRWPNDEIMGEKYVAEVVFRRYPKCDLLAAIIVSDTVLKVLQDDTKVIEFVHPITKQKSLLNMNFGDMYLDQETRKMYGIVVDKKKRTLLIFKGWMDKMKYLPVQYQSKADLHDTKDNCEPAPKQPKKKAKDNFNENTNQNINTNVRTSVPPSATNTRRSTVVGRKPKIDISKATYVMRTEKKRGPNGVWVIEFLHPDTKETIRVPVEGGHEYVERKTGRVFIICVDRRKRTILVFKGLLKDLDSKKNASINTNVNTNVNTNINGNTHVRKPNVFEKPSWGSIVVDRKPKYDIPKAIYIMETEKKRGPNGVWIIEFVHPDTKETIRVPFEGAEEYVERKTGRVFIICVDRRMQTLLVFKSYLEDLDSKKNTATDKPKDNYNNILQNTSWGSIVVDRKPKYDIPKAIYIMETEKKRGPNGVWIIEFVHPDTKETIRVPFEGAEEYVERKTGRVFIICVDRRMQTLLVFKSYLEDLDSKKNTATDKPKDNYNNILQNTSWGSVVIDGKPIYDILKAIYVLKTKKKREPNGVWIIEFVHPDTKETIRVPFEGAEEYVERKTGRVFIICVDRRMQTLLVFKSYLEDLDSKKNTATDKAKDNYNNILQNTSWGSVVIDGKPIYDILKAIYVLKTEKKREPNGVWVIEFVHPDTKETIRVPFEGADEYVERKTGRVFIICVDRRKKTLLILKPILKDVGSKKEAQVTQSPNNINTNINKNVNTNINGNIHVRKPNVSQWSSWGSIVVDGKPEYDIPKAIYVMKTEKKREPNGVWVIEFVHPYTNEIIRVPFEEADEYVVTKTEHVFVICVDRQKNTLLVFKGYLKDLDSKKNTATDKPKDNYNNILQNTSWGSVVIDGKPIYDILKAIYVLKTEKKRGPNGVWIIEFVHPDTKETIRVPFEGAEEYVERKTGRVFIICVDRRMQTLLVFKSYLEDLDSKKNTATDKPKDNYNNILHNTSWGSVVIDGKPIYDILKAIYVLKTKKKREPNGVWIIEFVHPDTKDTIRVPFEGAEEYVERKTGRVFIICVDRRMQTLLVFKSYLEDLDSKKNTATDKAKDNYNNILQNTSWGSVVIDGKPIYDILKAIYVLKTEKKREPNGVWVIEFVHPDTKETIRVPFEGADEYVERKTGRVFIICVDRRKKTLLILKPILKDVGSKKEAQVTQSPNNINTNINKNVNTNINGNIHVRKPNVSQWSSWGSIVVDGKPEYDIPKAIYVMKTEKKREPNGVWVIEFVHPYTNEIIRVPFEEADEYVVTKTEHVFVICVDRQKNTLLVFKGYLKDLDSKKNTATDKPKDNYNNILQNTSWGSVVIDGKPIYDILKAIYVLKTEKKREPNGVWIIEFVHPDTKETIRVPFEGAEEYVERKTGRVFIICVDRRMQTLLVFKSYLEDVDSKKNTATDKPKDNYNNILQKTSWGSIVVDGKPIYDILKAIYVLKTEKKRGPNGVWIIEFVHPDTKETIRVPFEGAEEYVERKTGRVFIICVDRRMQTLLVFKSYLEDLDSTKNTTTVTSNDNNNNILRNTSWGSIVVDGKPKYDIPKAIYVTKTEKKRGPNGVWIIEFVHPDTKETIRVSFEGADEYVEKRTGRAFIICVDRRKKTLLILKPLLKDLGSKKEAQVAQSPNNINTNVNKNVNTNINGNTDVRKPNVPQWPLWGSIVVDGKPKYDIPKAIYVMKTKKKRGPSGMWVIEFVHPYTNEIIRVPFEGADEYVVTKTEHVFVICVDRQQKTLLVFKGYLKDLDSKINTVTDKPKDSNNNILQNTSWGSIVVDGKPEYDIPQAIYVVKTEKKRGPNGVWIVEFVHPDTKETIRVPFEGAEEYVERKTGRVFIICVDRRMKTLLVFKRYLKDIDSKRNTTTSETKDNNNNILRNTSWGSIVVVGKPKYDISTAIYVMKTQKKRGLNGIWIIEFVHPDTKETIRVPLEGADEYVETKTNRVFVICVDRRGRTLLVFKGLDNQNSSKVHPNFVSGETEEDDSSDSNENYNVNTNINENIVSLKREKPVKQ